jgi:uncharacterized protein
MEVVADAESDQIASKPLRAIRTLAMSEETVSGPISCILLKVAARCNIDCSYCYWFRDSSVYARPKLLSQAVLYQLLKRVEEHIVAFSLPSFSIILHGGEPLLWGVEKFESLAEECRSVGARTGCAISLAVTTNGVLIDDLWLDCFESNDISVTVSIDGPAHIHDIHRRTFQGGATHALAERAVRRLQSRDIPVGILAVGNPAFDPKEYVAFFAELGLDGYDILLPDATLDDAPASIASFYCGLFDLWLEANRERHVVSIRTIEAIASGLLGGRSTAEGIGYGPIELCTVLTDGSMEPQDVLRIAGTGSTATTCNIFDNAIEDIKNEPRWQAARTASLDLCEKCKQCKFMRACGGGYLPHRFSKKNAYDNPSAYCDDLYAIFSHVQDVLANQVYLRKRDNRRIALSEAIQQPP